MEYFSADDFGNAAAAYRFQSQTPYWGSGEMTNPLVREVTKGTQIFRQHFRNIMGREPTKDELGKFQVNALADAFPNAIDPGYGTVAGISDSYINDTFGPEIAQMQQQAQTEAAKKQLDETQARGMDYVNKMNSQTQNYLMSPESQAQIQGKLNNQGILNGGAYSSTLASLMAQGANQNQANVLSGVTIPALSNMQELSGISGIPWQSSMRNGQAANKDLQGIRDFDMQANLASYLAQLGQPSGAQNMLGMATGAAGGAGGLMQGGAAAKNSTSSYICREMVKRGLLCDSDFQDFYLHLFPAIIYKGRAFWHYYKFGQKLVDLANQVWPDWPEKMKPILFTAVMQEKDPIRAVEIYSQGLRKLCFAVAPHLWDERVMRSSLLDSLIFLPRLLIFKAYRKNFWRIMRIKMLWLYDKPRCEVH